MSARGGWGWGRIEDVCVGEAGAVAGAVGGAGVGPPVRLGLQPPLQSGAEEEALLSGTVPTYTPFKSCWVFFSILGHL